MSDKIEYIEIGKHAFKDNGKYPRKRVKLDLSNKYSKNSCNDNDGYADHVIKETLNGKQSEGSSNGRSLVYNKRDLQIRTASLQDSFRAIKRVTINNYSTIIRVIKVTAICAIVLPPLAVISALTNYGNKDVRQSLSSWLDSLSCKNEELENILIRYFNKVIYADKDIDFLNRMDISREKLVNWLLSEFSYNIRCVNVSGRSAAVDIASESNSLHYLFGVIADTSNSIDINNTDLDGIYKRIGRSVLEKLNGSNTRKNSFTIKLEKINNIWEICDKDSVIFNLFVA